MRSLCSLLFISLLVLVPLQALAFEPVWCHGFFIVCRVKPAEKEYPFDGTGLQAKICFEQWPIHHWEEPSVMPYGILPYQRAGEIVSVLNAGCDPASVFYTEEQK